jgi:AcrR family transcriptional regulator
MSRPGPGRPPVAAERRTQILDAFIDLIAERGLESVSLDDVAQAAGVQRTMIRHFVGNRRDVIRDAVEVLAERYSRLIGSQIGVRPDLDRLIDHLFSDRWARGMATEDAALGQLLREAAHDDVTRTRIKSMYDRLLAELGRAIRTSNPDLPAKAGRDLAYVIVCAAEHNAVMRGLGFPRTSSKAAAATMRALIARQATAPVPS